MRPLIKLSFFIPSDDLGKWSKMRLPGYTRFPNGTTIADVNNDGRKDIILGSGFLACVKFPFGYCGGIYWYEQEPLKKWKRHKLFSGRKEFYHHVEFYDFDGDGIKDLVGVGESKVSKEDDGSSELHVFLGNESKLGFNQKEEEQYKISGLGSSPSVFDLDLDGKPEVYSSEYFGSNGSFSWVRFTEDNKLEKNYIDSSVGKSIQLSFIPNLLGDGKTYAIGSNHTNTQNIPEDPESGVYLYELPDMTDASFDATKPWKKRLISEGIVSRFSEKAGQAAPGVFAWGDIDGDGDIDIVVHGDGDPNIYWLKQDQGQFETIVLDRDLPQGAIAIKDLDHDGIAEIAISSYEANKLYIYKFNQ